MEFGGVRMIKLPGTQLLSVLAFIAVFAVIISFVFAPCFTISANTVKSIMSIYRKQENSELERLQNENKRLTALMADAGTTRDSSSMSSRWYSVLQENLHKYNIPAERITVKDSKRGQRIYEASYGFRCVSTYHDLGRLICALENGTEVCALNKIDMKSKSFTTGSVEADITVTFFGKPQ
jgi:hypothetical protein